MKNEELVMEIKNGKKELIEELWLNNQGIVKQIANKYKKLADFDDLVQEGYLAFNEVINRYDESKGSFVALLVEYVKAYILNYINNNQTFYVPRYLISGIRHYEKTYNHLKCKNGSEPTEEELSEAMSVPVWKVRDYNALSEMLNVSSLDAPLKADEQECVLDQINAGVNIEAEYLERETKEELHNALRVIIDKLPEQNRGIIIKYYLQGMESKDIALLYDITVAGVSAARKRALSKLRHHALSNVFLKEYREKMLTRAYGNNSFTLTGTSSTEDIAIKLVEKENGIKASSMKKMLKSYMEGVS